MNFSGQIQDRTRLAFQLVDNFNGFWLSIQKLLFVNYKKFLKDSCKCFDFMILM